MYNKWNLTWKPFFLSILFNSLIILLLGVGFNFSWQRKAEYILIDFTLEEGLQRGKAHKEDLKEKVPSLSKEGLVANQWEEKNNPSLKNNPSFGALNEVKSIDSVISNNEKVAEGDIFSPKEGSESSISMTLSQNSVGDSAKEERKVSGAGGNAEIQGSTGIGRSSTSKYLEEEVSLKKQYLKEHFAYIRELIMKNASYPYLARKMGWRGKVVLSFIILKDGSVKELCVIESSGYEVLDKSALEAVKKSSPFPQPPYPVKIVIPIVYNLQ